MIRIVSIIVATLLFCYIVFVSFFFRESRQKELCRDLQVVVVDSLGNHYVFQQFVFNPVGVDLVHRPLDRVQVSLLEDMHQIALAHKMLVKAVHDHYLQVTAQLLLLSGKQAEGVVP